MTVSYPVNYRSGGFGTYLLGGFHNSTYPNIGGDYSFCIVQGRPIPIAGNSLLLSCGCSRLAAAAAADHDHVLLPPPRHPLDIHQ